MLKGRVTSPDGRWLVVLSALSLAVSPISAALLAPILARLLGADGRGQLSAILAPLSLADAVATIGLPAAVTYFRARGVGSGTLLRLSAPLAIASSLATYGLLAGYASVVAPQQGIDAGVLRVVWAFVVIGLFLGVMRALRMGEQAWLSINLERIAAPVLRLIACSALILTGDIGVQAVAIVYLFSGLLGSAFLLVGSGARARSDAEGPSRRSLYGFGARSWFTSLSYMVNTRVDQVVLAGLIAPAQLGHYAVAVTIAELPSVLYKAANRILFSKIAAGGTWESAAQMNRVILWISAGGSAAIALVCPFVVPFVFGAEFEESVVLSQILLAASVLAAASSILSAAISGAGRPGSVSATEAIGVVVTVVGMICVVPLLGAVGASLTVLGAQAVILVCRGWEFRRMSGVSWRRIFVPTIADLALLRRRRA